MRSSATSSSTSRRTHRAGSGAHEPGHLKPDMPLQSAIHELWLASVLAAAPAFQTLHRRTSIVACRGLPAFPSCAGGELLDDIERKKKQKKLLPILWIVTTIRIEGIIKEEETNWYWDSFHIELRQIADAMIARMFYIGGRIVNNERWLRKQQFKWHQVVRIVC